MVETSPLHVIILAAGQGKRMHSALPKVLQPLGERTLIEACHGTAQALLASQSGGRVSVVHGHGGDQVRASLADLDCTWVEQREQKGTGHALLQVVPLLRDEELVLVLYSDVPLLRQATLAAVVDAARDGALGVLTVQMAEPTGYGRIIRAASGALVAIVEEKDATDAQRRIREVNTGIMAVSAKRLRAWLPAIGNNNAQGEYYLTDIVPMAVGEGVPVVAVQADSEAEVAGVNDKLQLAAAERHLQMRLAEELMRAGVTLRDPARFDLRGTLQVGRDVEIDVNVVIQGKVILGDRVRIEPNCIIKDSKIADDVVVHANSMLDQAVLGKGAQVGPFARLRPGSALAEAARIGNFVEIKQTTIGAGSKVNHLAYVGDAEVGANVNIGAGVITCNYDGANKYRTLIEDDAFIGSDCQLVAPVRVGKGATLGAGTTLTQDAPADKLTLSRAAQYTSQRWRRPTKTKG